MAKFVIAIEIILIIGFSILNVGSLEGNSMFPTINNGDLIFASKFRGEEINPGMIVGYSLLVSNNKDLILHRVIKVNKEHHSFIAKGDNNKEPDPWEIDISSGIKMIYRFRIPYLGHILSFLRFSN